MIDEDPAARAAPDLDPGSAQQVGRARDGGADDENTLAGLAPLTHRGGEELDLPIKVLDGETFEDVRLERRRHPIDMRTGFDSAWKHERRPPFERRADLLE